MIKYGKYCEACKGKMINNLSHAVVEEDQVVKVENKSDGNRMRFIET